MKFQLTSISLFFLLAGLAGANNIISECNSRLPMSLATVISDLEAEGINELGTACFLTSRGVTKSKKASFFGIEDASSTCFGTDDGICMALSPSSVPEVANTVVACSGNIIYYPDEVDLSRGEGLFDSLGPAMERILSQKFSTHTSLTIVSDNPATTKSQLEETASKVLGSLVASKKVSVLEDVFDKVDYVSSMDDAMKLLERSEEPSEAQAVIASTVASDFWQTSPVSLTASISARDLAAARQLGPAAREAFETAIETVKAMANEELVSNFGDLCEAATKRAMDELDSASSSNLGSSTIGKQIRENLKQEIAGELADMCEGQLELLKTACFEDFQRDLSKLRISPNLANDMQEVANKAVAEFGERSKKMPVTNANAKAAFKAELQEFCKERLLKARASGQFKPVPRKGVTIGLHWLLPKPFGNDFRQEPWMVHATDNLVYIPRDKISDVSPEDVAAGDWRSKIVPSPAGNEMIYMQ